MNQKECMQELSIFDLTENCEPSRNLIVVEAEFKRTHQMNWKDLFDGFDEMYAITYSSSIDFIGSVLPNFRYAEIVFGNENVLEDDVAMLISAQFSKLKFVAKHKSAKMISGRLDNETLKLMVSRDIRSHEKIYILKADDGRVRVIEGSANFSYSAFNGIQRENISFMDNESAYEHYRERYEQFKEGCADNVTHSAFARIIIDPDAAIEGMMDIVPIAGTINTKKIVELEGSDDPEYVIAADAANISKDIKPIVPKRDKHGKTVLIPSEFSKMKRRYKENRDSKKAEQKKTPKLHIDVESRRMTFNDNECSLYPERERVKNDMKCFLEYMGGFETFSGDVEKNLRTYFLFANWYLVSPFMPYLRIVASQNGQDIKQFPVYAILYGESNGGKTEFINLLTKMMCGKRIPVNKSSDFTNTTIDELKQVCEGLPIVIDDLSQTQYRNHISNIVKYDEWGIKEHLVFYPSVAITTNEISSIKSDISKRVFVCHIDSCLDKDKGRANYKRISGCMSEMGNAFYCEYVRRMMDRVEHMVSQMKSSDDSYLPDIFAESSGVIIEIAKEVFEGNLPTYMYKCEFNDYFGNKAVGRNAIQKIRTRWKYEQSAFTVHKKKGVLEYRIPDNENTYVLEHIRQELPPSLNAQITSRTLTMDLDAARDFFDIDFRKSVFDMFREK